MAECPKHPGVEAVGTCTRCGRFFCAAEARDVGGAKYCGDCAVRDDVDWLGKHYAQFEGKRSGLIIGVAVIGVLLGVAGLLTFMSPDSTGREVWLGTALVLWGVPCIALAGGKPQSRWLLAAAAPLSAGAFGLATEEAIAAVFAGLLLGLFALTVFRDLRTRLYFRVPVSRDELRKHFDRYGSNPLAVAASRLAFVSLIIPGLGLVSLVLAFVALARVDKKAIPPVGNVGTAVGAIFFSLFTCAIWAANLAWRF